MAVEIKQQDDSAPEAPAVVAKEEQPAPNYRGTCWSCGEQVDSSQMENTCYHCGGPMEWF